MLDLSNDSVLPYFRHKLQWSLEAAHYYIHDIAHDKVGVASLHDWASSSHLWFMDTFFARRKEEEDGGESTDDNDNNNNNNLNNNSDNGDSTASKGTLDTALVHSDIEEEASSSSFIRTCVRYKQMICVNSVLLTLTLLTQTHYISTSKPYLDLTRLHFILAVHTSGGPFGHRSGSLCAS